MRIAFIGSTVIATFLVAACGGDENAPSNPTVTPAPTSVDSPAVGELFVLVGGGSFRACVQTIDENLSLEEAVSAVEAGFEQVAGEGRWPTGWDAPVVDRGCPLPPLALTETDKPFVERRVCREQTSGYLVHLYVGGAPRFEERFAGSRLRVAPHEYLAVDAQCFGWVSLAWYVTPDELEDGVLRDYVSNVIEGQHS